LLVFAVGLELSLRTFGPFLPGWYRTGPAIERDEKVGWTHIAGESTWYRRPWATIRLDVNAQGRVGPLIEAASAAGVRRVVLLGDSFAEGAYTPTAFTVAGLLSRPTSVLGRVEIVNEGVSGYGTDQDVLVFEERDRAIHADAVVLLFTVANDVWNNDWLLEGRFPQGAKPHFDLDGAKLRLVPLSGPPNLADQIRQFVSRSYLVGTVKSGIVERFTTDRSAPVLRELQLGVLEEPRGEWIRAWQITVALLERLRDDARALGVPLVVLVAPDACQVHPADCGGHAELSGSDVPQTLLSAAAATLNVPLVDPLPAFRAAAASERLYYVGDLHWNERGQAIAVEALLPALRAALDPKR